MMDSKIFSEQITNFLDEASKGLSPELIEWLKEQFELHMDMWLGENLGSLQVSLVIDSNIAIQALNYFAKGKTSIIFKLAKNPLFPIYAPIELEDEVMNHIRNLEDSELKKKFLKGWELLKVNFQFKEIQNPSIEDAAMEIIGNQDVKDVPFVGIYLETDAKIILTDDKHFVHPTIKKFGIEGLGNIVGVFHRGMFSFFIMNNLTPPVFEFLKNLTLSITKLLAEFVGFLFELIKTVLGGAFDKIVSLLQRAPSWFIWMLMGAGVASAIVLVFSENARKKVSDIAKSIWNKTKPVIEKIVSFLLKIIKSLIHYAEIAGPYAGMAAVALNELTTNIKTIKEELKKLETENIASFS